MGTAWRFPPPGIILEAGASRLHLQIAGSGKPAVVLEAGIAATSLSWALVQPELAKFTTVVSYDRAGLGWSGPATTPRTPGVIASELRCALERAGVRPPYVMVGHSFGGLVVQRFATLYKGDVSGLVLVDALDAAGWCALTPARQRMLAQGVRLSRRGAMLARLGIVGASLRILLAGNRVLPRLAARITSGGGGSGFTDRLVGEVRKLPRTLWPAIAWQWSQPKNFEGMAKHLECLTESAAEMAAQGELDPGLPVTVLLAGHTPVPNSPLDWRVVRATGSGHWIQLDRPDIVIAAVREMLPPRVS
jgi:pimeloyl-ACP methyl ester carboxylesterase